MKKSSVQLGLRRSLTPREIGSAPSIGRIGRFNSGTNPSGAPIPDSARIRRGKQRRAIIIGWSLALSTLAITILVASFVVWMKPILARSKHPSGHNQATDPARVRVASKFPSPSKEQAIATVRSALAVRDPGAVPSLIRTGHTPPDDIVKFLANLEPSEGTIQDCLWLSTIDKNNLLLEGVQIVLKQPDRLRSRIAFLTPDEKGVWKLDFAALARLTEPSWPTLLAADSFPKATIRVYAGRDRYYNGPYADESAWSVYGMGSEDLDVALYGYAKRGTPQFDAMERLVAADEKSLIRATLEIRKIAGSQKRQFEITRVLAEDWVLSDIPFDETTP